MAGSGRSKEGWGRRSVVAVAGERGIEGRPWACAMACAFVATAASQSATEAEQGHSEDGPGACALERGVDGAILVRQQRGGSRRSERARQRRSSAGVRARVALRAQGGQGERGGRESKGDLVNGLTRFKLNIFN